MVHLAAVAVEVIVAVAEVPVAATVVVAEALVAVTAEAVEADVASLVVEVTLPSAVDPVDSHHVAHQADSLAEAPAVVTVGVSAVDAEEASASAVSAAVVST